MPESIQEERLRWVLPIIKKETKLVDVARVCPFSERTLKRWCKAFREGGKEALIPKSTRPKTNPNETPIRVKEEVIALRKETGLCAKKLHWRLKKEKNINVPVRTIGKILKQEGLVRKYRTRRKKYKYIKAKLSPGEMIEIDVKYVPGRISGRRYYQYTAIDVATRWRHLKVFEHQGTHESILFLKEVMKRFPHRVKAIKTDNHSVFTNWGVGANKRSDRTIKRLHALDAFCARHDIVHYLIDPGKPAQNGKVERSHREDQEKFYDKNTFKSFGQLQKKIRIWNTYYNNLEHCALDGKTPNEMVEQKVTKVLA